jgi:hypothetical protein
MFGRVFLYTDAYNLQCVRELDPDAAMKSVPRINDGENSDDEEMGIRTPRRSVQHAYGNRIAKELSRYSCHEAIAMAMLVEIICAPAIGKVIVPELCQIRLYKRDKTATQQLSITAARCVEAVTADLHKSLKSIIDTLARVEAEDDLGNSTGSRSIAEGPSRTMSVMTVNEMAEGVESLVQARREHLESFEDYTQATAGNSQATNKPTKTPRCKAAKVPPVEIDVPTSQEDELLAPRPKTKTRSKEESKTEEEEEEPVSRAKKGKTNHEPEVSRKKTRARGRESDSEESFLPSQK